MIARSEVVDREIEIALAASMRTATLNGTYTCDDFGSEQYVYAIAVGSTYSDDPGLPSALAAVP